MARQDDCKYDVFISYNLADEEWVSEWLLPRLQKSGLRVATRYETRILGIPQITNIERGIDSSYFTVVVLSPVSVADDWIYFETVLAIDKDPAAREGKLIPLLLKPCDIPIEIRFRERVNFTIEKRYWEKEYKALEKTLIRATPAPTPWPKKNTPHYSASWSRWFRRYRWRIFWSVITVWLVWMTIFALFGIPPFQPRLVWVGELPDVPNATALYKTDISLIVGGINDRESCEFSNKRLRYKFLASGSSWQNSDVGNALCIEDFQPVASLSDIITFAASPNSPNTIYALTSHSGLLVSLDGGAKFEQWIAHLPMDLANNRPNLLVVSGNQSLIFWVTGLQRGLWAYQNEQWHQLDKTGDNSCVGLPESLTVRSLLVTERVVLIGTYKQGLWASTDGGRTCDQVFDQSGRYEIRGLWDVSKEPGYSRYLVLVRDWRVNPGDAGVWELLNLCPRSAACTQIPWQTEPNPVWQQEATLIQPSVDNVLILKNKNDYEWYLVTELGQIWRGDMQGNDAIRMPGISRCYNFFTLCNARFAPSEQDGYPYLLAADRVYQYKQDDWWRYWWP